MLTINRNRTVTTVLITTTEKDDLVGCMWPPKVQCANCSICLTYKVINNTAAMRGMTDIGYGNVL